MSRIAPSFFSTIDRIGGAVGGASSALGSASADLAGVKAAGAAAGSPLARAASQLDLGVELLTSARGAVADRGLRASITEARTGVQALADDVRGTASTMGTTADADLASTLAAQQSRADELGTQVEALRTRAQAADIAAADSAPKAAKGDAGVSAAKAKTGIGAKVGGFAKANPGIALMGGLIGAMGAYIGIKAIVHAIAGGEAVPTKSPAVPNAEGANTVDSVVGALLTTYDRHADGVIHLAAKEYEVTDAAQTTAARKLLDSANGDHDDVVTTAELKTFVAGYDDGAGAPALAHDGKLSADEYGRFRADWSDAPKAAAAADS